MRNAIFLFLTFCAQLVLSQDLIVKSTGDSLNCLITRNENSYMYFNRIENHRLKRDSLALADIKAFKVDYFTSKKKEVEPSVIPKVVYPTQTNTSKEGAKYTPSITLNYKNTFLLSANIGLVLRLNNPNEKYGPEFEEYFKDLYTGITIGAEAAYFLNENIGFGLQFSKYSSNVKVSGTIDTSGIVNFGTISDAVSIIYIGPTFYYRYISQNSKSIFLGHVSIGNTFYSNDIDIIIYQYNESGNNISTSVGATYQYMIDKSFSIGASVDYHSATITQLTYDDGIEKFTSSLFPEDVSRIDLKLLLAYWF